MLNVWLFLICYNIKAEDLIDEMGDFILKAPLLQMGGDYSLIYYV